GQPCPAAQPFGGPLERGAAGAIRACPLSWRGAVGSLSWYGGRSWSRRPLGQCGSSLCVYVLRPRTWWPHPAHHWSVSRWALFGGGRCIPLRRRLYCLGGPLIRRMAHYWVMCGSCPCRSWTRRPKPLPFCVVVAVCVNGK
ncbi:unnamed protein product, partial [Amoebophrya sp. A120]